MVTPTYPRVGLKPLAERHQVPTMLRLALSPQMVMLCEIHGGLIANLSRYATSAYITRADAQRIYEAIPPEGRTGMALRRRVAKLIRRWNAK